MERMKIDVDPYANDPGRWGASLANNAEFLFGCLDAAAPRSVVEVGAYAGDLTRLLLEWAKPTGARIVAIDPVPKAPLEQLEQEHAGDLQLVRATSHVGLAEIDLPDVAILDGDHNYFTVAGELRIIAERAGDAPLPLLLFHDVGWPHARRDAYEAPDSIPEEHRRPLVRGGGLFPGEPGIRPGGLPMWASATTEGGPRNGVLTAIEDFIAGRDDLRLAIVPSFFGFGALWQLDAPYADALATLLDPWDRNPILERLEANRVLHLASSHFQMTQAAQAGERDRRKGELLQKLLISKSFAVGQAISRLRQRGEPAFSKAEITALLDER